MAGLPLPDGFRTSVSRSCSRGRPNVIECFNPLETVTFSQHTKQAGIVAQMRHQTRAFPPFFRAELPHGLIFDSSEIHLISLFWRHSEGTTDWSGILGHAYLGSSSQSAARAARILAADLSARAPLHARPRPRLRTAWRQRDNALTSLSAGGDRRRCTGHDARAGDGCRYGESGAVSEETCKCHGAAIRPVKPAPYRMACPARK
jgi:hypothetical protein